MVVRVVMTSGSVRSSIRAARPDLAARSKAGANSSVRVTSSYSFSSPNGIPLPILRGLRLRSTMSLSVSISYKSDQTFTGADSVATALLPLTSSSTVLSIAPQATYSFSLRMKGGMTAEWSDRSDRSPSSGRRKTHVRSLGIWAEFTF